tara:strand:- start:1715 stop:2365 length:651 start_codon:yes stop_codon:yes gene_type:complete
MDDGKNLDEGDDFFTSQMNFDLESKSKPKRRRRRRKRGEKPPAPPVQMRNSELKKRREKTKKINHDEIPVQSDEIGVCPGCGSEVDEGEYVDAVISFVTGSYDYLAGDPVRTQTIQNLKQQAKELEIPEPYDDWLLEVCARIEAQINRSMDMKEETLKELEEEMRRKLIIELYEHVRNDVGAQIREEIENEIRGEVESEMWEQFEKMYRERENQED